MTYTVSSGTLNPTQLNSRGIMQAGWVIVYAIFLRGPAQQRRSQKKLNLTQRLPRDEDDIRTLNTRITQRKRAIPHCDENASPACHVHDVRFSTGAL